jgi:hypothetical protein
MAQATEEQETKVKEGGRQMAPFRIDRKVYGAFKVRCAKEGRAMNVVLTKLVEKYNKGEIKL